METTCNVQARSIARTHQIKRMRRVAHVPSRAWTLVQIFAWFANERQNPMSNADYLAACELSATETGVDLQKELRLQKRPACKIA